MRKVLFIAKTNLNNDGRILNQLRILINHFKEELSVDFILLPDKSTNISLDKKIVLHEINPVFRRNSLLRPFTVLEFTIRSLIMMLKLKSEIIHVQDLAVVLPVYIYRLLKGKSFKLIYDDHEMPNENESIQYRIFQYFEVKLMKKADFVVFANKERMDILQRKHNLKNKLLYFLNLPYFDNDDNTISINDEYQSIISEIKDLKSKGIKFIIHQGSLEFERGRSMLADFSKRIGTDIKIMIVGVPRTELNDFISEYKLDINNFHFVGRVPYNVLNIFWKLNSAAIVMYLPTYINNRLCAPNRFYIAIKNQLPILVNKDNPVLSNFIKEYKAGFFIEDMKNEEDLKQVLDYTYKVDIMREIIEEESRKLINIYDVSLFNKKAHEY